MRLVRAVKLFVSKCLLILFILAMAVLPIPMAPLMARLLRLPARRSVAAEVLRKKKGEEPG